MVFQGKLKGVSMKYKGCFMQVSRIGRFQGCLNKVSGVFQGRLKGVLRTFQRSSKDNLRKF